MKTFLLFFSLLIFATAHGQVKEINSLNIDSCWLDRHQLEASPVKWVNFSTDSMGMIESELIHAVTERVDQEYGFLLKSEQLSAQALFHCSSQHSSLVVNINYGNSRVCAWVSLDDNTPVLERVGVEPVLHEGYCYGAVFSEALLSLKNSAYLDEAMGLIQERLKKDEIVIEEQRVLSDRVLVLKFSSNIVMAQEKILNELSSELKARGLASALELNYYQVETGEFHPLD